MTTVIIIMTILAVTSAPKFLNVADDALSNQRAMIAATFQSSITNVRTMWIVDGSPPATNNNNGAQVTLNDETTVTIDDTYGFPVGSNGRDRVNNFNLADCESVFNDLVEHDFSTARRGQVNNNNFKDHDIIVTRQNSNPDICHYTWSESIDSRPANNAPSAGAGFSYNPAMGVITTFDFN